MYAFQLPGLSPAPVSIRNKPCGPQLNSNCCGVGGAYVKTRPVPVMITSAGLVPSNGPRAASVIARAAYGPTVLKPPPVSPAGGAECGQACWYARTKAGSVIDRKP